MRSQYTGSPAAARRSLVASLMGAGWPRDEAERRVDQIAPRLPRELRGTVGLAPAHVDHSKPLRLRWAIQRRSLERNGSFNDAQFARMVAFYGCCLRCERDDVPLLPDHIIPLSKGGKHHVDNIQPLCWPCNSWKGTRIIDYRAGRPRMD